MALYVRSCFLPYILLGCGLVLACFHARLEVSRGSRSSGRNAVCCASQSAGLPKLQPACTFTVSDRIYEQLHVQHIFNLSNLSKLNLEVTDMHFL